MMKKILAVALASAFAAPAFADTPNVNVYGVVNVGVESVDNGVQRKSRVTSGNNSAIGFKGSEDLGGGMKANWQIETNVSFDGDNNSTGAAATNVGAGALNGTRNTWGGLSGGWGEVRIGVHDTPYKMSTGGLDMFVATLGDYNTLLGAGTGAPASALADLRTGNTVAYLSPNMGGFSFAGAYVFSTERGVTATSDEGDGYSLSATYAQGPLFLTGAYEKANLTTGGASSNGGVVMPNNGLNGVLGAGDVKSWKIGAGFKMAAFQVGAIYEKIDVTADTVGSADWSTWYLNAAYTMGAMKFKAAYGKSGDSASGADDGAKNMALGMDYSFSKRTMLQLTYAKVDNDTNGEWVLSQGGNTVGTAASVLGTDASGYGVNLVHRF